MGDAEELAFLSWFTEHGGWIDQSLSLEKIPGMGRGLVATRPIAENERLFSIPRSMLLNLGTSALVPACEAAERARPPKAGHAWSDVMDRGWCPLILMLMWEHRHASTQEQNERFTWGPYFGIMPTSFTTPMFWNSNELRELQGTDVQDKIGRTEAEADYYECVLPYVQQYPDVFLGPGVHDVPAEISKWYHIDLYHRMGSLLLSRSFHVKRDLNHAESDDADISSAPAEVAVERAIPRNEAQDEQGDDEEEEAEIEIQDDEDDEEKEENEEDVRDISMVPMADMLNAKFGSENTRCFYKREALEMRCTRPIAVGEQLLNTYGNPPNSDLLRRYGFVDEPNRGDLLELPATTIFDAALTKLSLATQVSEDVIRTFLMPRFEWACTELGIDEVFLLCRLSKPKNTAPYAGTLSLDTSRPLTSADRRVLSRASGEISDDLVGFARLLCVTQDDFERAKKKEALPNARLDAVEVIDASWPGSPPKGAMLSVASVLRDALALRGQAYPTTWKDTAKALVECTASSEDPYRMALVVRAGDQAILQEHTTVTELVLAHARAQASGAASNPAPSKKARRT